MTLIYKNAGSDDGERLSEIAQISKQNWGYSDAEMKLWETDLRVDADYIAKNQVSIVYADDTLIGFYACAKIDNDILEIDHLWLLPNQKRKGFGSEIFKHIIETARENQFKKAILIAEPNATGFYEKMGGIVGGKFQSKIPNRVLDIYHFNLETTFQS